jgi:hypothetical protein
VGEEIKQFVVFLQDKNLPAKGGNAVLIFSLVLSFCIKVKERTDKKMKFRRNKAY